MTGRATTGWAATGGSPLIPVSWGELLDKIVILEIKAERLAAAAARANVRAELACLRSVAGALPAELAQHWSGLRAVNSRLWRMEEQVRARDAVGDFGPGFVALARAIHRDNDERARIKQSVNRVLRSVLVEEKQYAPYNVAP